MANRVRVLTDSCCDLPSELTRTRGITVIPITVQLGGDLLKDGAEITPEQFYTRVQQEGLAPTTAQLTPYEFGQQYKAATADGHEAVYVGLSSGLSNGVLNGIAAAQEPEFAGRVEVVDSLGASVGIGLMALRAADLADQGRSAREIKADLDEYRKTVYHLFTLDTLDFAMRSGRISRMAGLAAGLLDIKPVLQVDMAGRLVPFDKVRGRKRALNRLFAEMERIGHSVAGRRVGVSHAHDPETAAELAERFRSQYGAAEVIVGPIGATIGTHVGPGCVSIFFEGPAGRGSEA